MSTVPSPDFSPLPKEHHPHLVPAWLVPLLSTPLRKIWDRPTQYVLPFIHPGSRILELGPGSGFFTLPMAEATGSTGFVACVELQASVRERLEQKLAKKHYHWTKVRPCTDRDLQVPDLSRSMDLVVAIHVLHEMPDPAAALWQMSQCLKPGGQLLILEPRGHCPKSVFEAELTWAGQCGLQHEPDLKNLPSRSLGALFRSPCQD